MIHSPVCQEVPAEDLLRCDDIDGESSFFHTIQEYGSGAWNAVKEPALNTLHWFASPSAVKLKTMAQTSKAFDDAVHDIALTTRNEWIETYDELDEYQPRYDFYPYNLVSGLMNSIVATGLTALSGISSIVVSSLQDVYQTHQQFPCLHLEKPAEIATAAVFQAAETTLMPARGGSNALMESIARARYERSLLRKTRMRRNSGAKRRTSRQQNRVENEVFQSTQIALTGRVRKNIRDMRRAGPESRIALTRFDWLRDDIRNNGPMNIHERWELKPLQGLKNIYRVHVRGLAYVACFKLLDNDSIEFIFFGPHETSGLKYKNCKRYIQLLYTLYPFNVFGECDLRSEGTFCQTFHTKR